MALKSFTAKPEADLIGLDDGRKLAKFRAIDDAGASITATPEQIAAALAEQNILAGPAGPQGEQGPQGATGVTGPRGLQGYAMDYSILSQQGISGEFALNSNQARSSAVYVNTFICTKDGVSRIPLVSIAPPGYILDAWGSIISSNDIGLINPITAASILVVSKTTYGRTYGIDTTRPSFLNYNTIPVGTTYCVTLKYVK